ncbi:MAG: division plane positioning ATPase MipZ [Dongiaceae bacterium]
MTPAPSALRQKPLRRRPHVIVLGNEKGGSGKSTTTMHVVVALLREGWRVGCLDLDARQGTLSRYLENRNATAAELDLPMPMHRRLARSVADSALKARAEEADRFVAVMAELADNDFVVIDTPGSDSHLSRLGHARADTLVTPLNDSLLDLDLLARFDAEGKKILGPSIYAEMVWEQKKARALADGGSIDWIVMRNRLSHLDARNKRRIGKLLDELSKRIGFRLAPGFSERVIFRELFARGLTLFDLRQKGTGVSLTLSHLAARQEVRGLLEAIGLPEAEGKPVGGVEPTHRSAQIRG